MSSFGTGQFLPRTNAGVSNLRRAIIPCNDCTQDEIASRYFFDLPHLVEEQGSAFDLSDSTGGAFAHVERGQAQDYNQAYIQPALGQAVIETTAKAKIDANIATGTWTLPAVTTQGSNRLLLLFIATFSSTGTSRATQVTWNGNIYTPDALEVSIQQGGTGKIQAFIIPNPPAATSDAVFTINNTDLDEGSAIAICLSNVDLLAPTAGLVGSGPTGSNSFPQEIWFTNPSVKYRQLVLWYLMTNLNRTADSKAEFVQSWDITTPGGSTLVERITGLSTLEGSELWKSWGDSDGPTLRRFRLSTESAFAGLSLAINAVPFVLDISDSYSSEDATVTPGSSGITGTASITESPDTISSAGVITIVGAASVTEGADTVSSGSSLALLAALSATEGADTVSSAAALAIAAALANTEGADTASSAAALALLASLSATEGADTLSASGSSLVGVTGTASITEGADVATAAAALALAAAFSKTEGADTISSAAVLAISAALNKTEAPDTMSSGGTSPRNASVSATEAPDTSASTGSLTLVAVLAKVEAPDTVSASGFQTFPQTIRPPLLLAVGVRTADAVVALGARYLTGAEAEALLAVSTPVTRNLTLAEALSLADVADAEALLAVGTPVTRSLTIPARARYAVVEEPGSFVTVDTEFEVSV